jgi:amidohydrolase
MDVDALKHRVVENVDALADVLVDASHRIHDRPELGYEEHFAHELLTSLVERQGLVVTRGAYGLDTAFEAVAGADGPVIAICCEYDALPGVGHACGHNIIATAGLGAGLAAAAVAAEAGGRVAILGTPAEEGGGGKVRMADRGAFDGVAAAMMVHPAHADLPEMRTLAIQQLWVTYRGEAAHAAAFPHKGRNALDAAVLGYINVAALRQHIRPDERVHGIFTEAGDQANVVPDHTAARWYVRSPDLAGLEALKPRVLRCLEAGAAAAACEMTIDWRQPVYADLVTNRPLLDLYRTNAAAVGRALADGPGAPEVVGSTDMGNVSYLVPSIHPMIQVSPPDVSIHSHEFARWAAAPEGDRAVLDGAKAMAMTVVDLWARPGALAEVTAAHQVG